MMEKLPPVIGRSLRRVRPGLDRLVSAKHARDVPVLSLRSEAFGELEPLPARYTADGEGVSPPLEWAGMPTGTRSLALIVEDADSPTPSPLVHAIAVRISPMLDELAPGDLDGHAPGLSIGRNSYMRPGWLPPDPPPGHGVHRYAFQLFALDDDRDVSEHPGRGAFVRMLDGHVLAAGRLIATYSR
jgi:Raf kinase inhibitor-like YbhB/YbcL family protein